MKLVFVHGWGVRNTATYGELPARLEEELARRGQPASLDHIYLGKYISFSDAVSIDDLAIAFDAAVREKGLDNFACITHSTGGPLVRNWVSRFHVKNLSECPLKHLIMLAPANHGSALAQLGKGRLSRIKAFFENIEPGQRILDWLELGSEEQWALNKQWLSLDGPEQGFFPFVLTGQSIDRKFYDHLNSYTGEPGSDGVIRVAGANLNYEYVRLEDQGDGRLKAVRWQRPCEHALAVLPGMAHGGEKIGIMTSVKRVGLHPVVDPILDCLAVKNESDYEALSARFQIDSEQVQASEAVDRWRSTGRDFHRSNGTHSMIVFRVVDNRGALIEDFDLLFTAQEPGKIIASPDFLPQGFFRDRQSNSRHPGRLTYYLDHEKLAQTAVGLRINARPDEGLVRYQSAEIEPHQLGAVLRKNETLMVEIVLQRLVGRECFVLEKLAA